MASSESRLTSAGTPVITLSGEGRTRGRTRQIPRGSSLLLLSMAVLWWLTGCADHVRYHPGFYTRFVKGRVTLSAASQETHPFIVVQKHHRTFIDTSEGPLFRVSASIVHPDENGWYNVPFESDVARLDLFFYARKHRVESFRFDRTLGVGEYGYDVLLNPDNDWKNSFFLLIKPTLSEYITEPRYEMTQRDRLFIGEWLGEIEQQF